jgi:hypothetical protein
MREYGSPSKTVIKTPIVIPEVYANEYCIGMGLIYQVQHHAFAGEEGEDSRLHLSIFDSLCRTFKQKGLPLDFVLLKLFRCSLKRKALARLQ